MQRIFALVFGVLALVPTRVRADRVASRVLAVYVLEADEYHEGIAPRGFDSGEVAAYLVGAIDDKTPLAVLQHAETVARFYDAHELATSLRAPLARSVAGSTDLERAIVMARIVALGPPAAAAAAQAAFVELCKRATTVTQIRDLIALFAVLDLSTDGTPLATAMARMQTALSSSKADDYGAHVTLLEIEGHLHDALYRAQKAHEVERAILATPNRAARLQRCIDIYLGIDQTTGFVEYVNEWAIARIRRETWGEDPAEHATRGASTPARAPLRNDVTNAFRAAIKRLLSDENRDGARVRALRAIRFFGGTITAAESKFLAAHAATQSDYLANEGFLIDR